MGVSRAEGVMRWRSKWASKVSQVLAYFQQKSGEVVFAANPSGSGMPGWDDRLPVVSSRSSSTTG